MAKRSNRNYFFFLKVTRKPLQLQTYDNTLGKLFTLELNHRYLEEYSVLNANQAGFRKGYSCADHIFTLQSLFQILKCKKQKLYRTFVDFSAAFDKVHSGRNYFVMPLTVNDSSSSIICTITLNRASP